LAEPYHYQDKVVNPKIKLWRKKMKRLLSVALAIILSLSLLSIAVSASSEEPELLPEEAAVIQDGTEALPEEGEEAAGPSEEPETAVDGAEDTAGAVAINAANFPDDVFRAYISEYYDTDEDGVLSPSEIEDVTYIYIETTVKSLMGVSYFTSLRELSGYDAKVESIDLSGLNAIESVNLWQCDQLKELVLGENSSLTYLSCIGSPLEAIDVSGLSALKELHLCESNISSLSVRENKALEELYCYENKLTSVDVSANTELRLLQCSNNSIAKLDISNNKKLQSLTCRECQLTTLDLTNAPALTSLSCEGNKLTTLDISNNPLLEILYCHGNQIKALNIANNEKIIDIISTDKKYDYMDPDYPEAYVYGEWEGNSFKWCVSVDADTQFVYTEPSTPNVVVPSHVCTAELLEMTEAVDADCETKGNIAYYTCTTCGKLYADEQGTKELKKADTVLPALGHDWDEGSITKLAEAGQPGEKRYVCQRDSSHTDIVEFDLQTKPVLAEVATTDALTEAGFDTAESIQTALIQVAAEQSGYTGDNAATYEVTLYISLDDGLTWVEATEENIPAQGITVVLPYPQGTNGDDYDFVVTHMFGADGDGHKAGDVETLAVAKTAEGLRVTVKSLSPFGVAWKAVEKAASGTNNGASALPSSKPKTGDNSPIALWAGVFVLCAAAVVITAKKRYSRT
jgi:hypothetical protein